MVFHGLQEGKVSGPIGSADDALNVPVPDSAGRKTTRVVRKYFLQGPPWVVTLW